jgi:hypothetical protein
VELTLPLGVAAFAVSDAVTLGVNAPGVTLAAMGGASQVSTAGDPLAPHTNPVGNALPPATFAVVIAAYVYPPNPFVVVYTGDLQFTAPAHVSVGTP